MAPAMAKPVQKSCTHLTASHLIKEVTDCLGEIPDHRPNHCVNGIPFGNFPKSAFAMMQMKIPSMLRFDSERADPTRAHNLETLFDVVKGRVSWASEPKITKPSGLRGTVNTAVVH